MACGFSSLANPGFTNRDATSFAATSPLSKRETGHCSIEKSSLAQARRGRRENIGEMRDVLLLDTIGRVERRAPVGMNGSIAPFGAPRPRKFETCTMSDAGSRLSFLLSSRSTLEAGKEIERVPQLRGVEPAFDIGEVPVAKTLGVADPRPAFADGRREGQRLTPFAPLMAPSPSRCARSDRATAG